MADENFGSPGGSTFHGELKNRFMGKSVKFSPLSVHSQARSSLPPCVMCLRDWWDVCCHKIHTWKEFHDQFHAAFLSEDYEDELAESCTIERGWKRQSLYHHVPVTMQGLENKYCGLGNTQIDFEKQYTQLACQLELPVDGLVRLGQQLKKEHVC